MADNDFAFDFVHEQAAAKPRAPKVAPAAPAPVQDISGYLADPTTLPEGKWPLSPEQKDQIRKAWPVLQREIKPVSDVEETKSSQLNQHLDQLLNLGEHVYGGKADRKALEAVGRHYEWIRKKEHETGGIKEAIALPSWLGNTEVKASDKDPIEGLKGPSKANALSQLAMVEILKTKLGAAGVNTSPFTIITQNLPSPKDTPEIAASKRANYAAQVQHFAEEFPTKNWRTAVKHQLRAKALAAGQPAPVSNVSTNHAPDKVAPYGLSGVITGQQGGEEQPEMGTAEAIGRGALHGATSLSVPLLASLGHAISSMHSESARHPFAYGGAGMSAIAPPEILNNEAAPPATSFGELNTKFRNFVEDPEKLAQAREEHPIATGIGTFAGGFADPATYLLGPLAGLGKLSPVAEALLGRAIQGGVAGGLSSAGETGQAPTVKSVLMAMGLGAILGKVADKVLESPAEAKVIKSIVEKYGEKAGPGVAEVAAKKAVIQQAAQGTPEMRAVTAGEPHAISELGPKLVDRRNALFEKGGVAPDSKAGKAVLAVEEAIDRGDVKAAEEGRAEIRKKFGKYADEMEKLFTAREVLAAARSGAHGHGNVSQYAANVHPMATLANPTASLGAQGAAAVHEGMVRGAGSLPMLAIAGARRAMSVPAKTAQQALAKLWYARQQGESTIMQKAAEEAIHLGVPLATVNALAGYSARRDMEQGE